MKLLVHSCCGPCSTYSLGHLRSLGHEVTSLFYNPNIHPFTEFVFRKNAFREFAEKENYDVRIEEEYGLRTFIEKTEGLQYDRKKRCEACYKMRFEKTAKTALELGCEAFSTTLTISPYQDHELIEKVGAQTGEALGVKFLYFDFRDGYKESIRLSKDMGLYRQKYCGCIFSEEERYKKQE